MGIVSFFKKVFHIGDKNKKIAIQSDSHRFASPSIDSASIHIDSKSINQSINQSQNEENRAHFTTIDQYNREEKTSSDIAKSHNKSVLLEENSLKLGVAAGFVGKSLIQLEDNLSSLNSRILDKQWADTILLPSIKDIYKEISNLRNMLASHEQNEEDRFESIISAIESIRSVASNLPEPEKNIIISNLEEIKKHQLTPKMKELISIVKDYGEISYSDLSEKLNITQDALRGLLSRTIKLTDELERFQKSGKGWVRFKAIHIDSIENQSQNLLDNNQKTDKMENKNSQTHTNNQEIQDLSDLP